MVRMDPKQHVRELEEAVVDAWPASDTLELDGWLLRASGGPTHRGNSVATLDGGSAESLDTRIAQAEAWYRERQLRPMFQLGPCAAPSGLDAALAERGYRQEGDAVAVVAEPTEVLARSRAARSSLARGNARFDLETSITAKATVAWSELSLGSSRFSATPDVFNGFIARLGSRCRFALVRDHQGQPMASCLAIASEDRLGIYAMFTLPERRRKGAGKALLHTLAESAVAHGVRELYLLVESDSLARPLYAQVGFRDLYRYHYRVLDGEPQGAPLPA
jgi:GNAT superfamily N-acetyltransferase